MSESLTIRDEPFGHYPGLVAAHGLVPNLFRAQGELPRVIEAEERLIDAVLVREKVLSRPQKESLLCAVAGACGNGYCQALYGRSLRTVSEKDTALLKFAGKLAGRAPWFSGKDVQVFRDTGFDDAAILESVITIALGRFLCTLACAFRPELDPGLPLPVSSEPLRFPESFDWVETPGPYLQQESRPAEGFPSYASFREQYGFVPNLFRTQTVRPDVLEAEVHALEKILLPEDHLSRIQKETILLVISAANLNTYWVSVQGQMLSALGVPPEESDHLVEDHQEAAIKAGDIALLDEVRKLAFPLAPPGAGFEWDALRPHGFSAAQIVEAVAMSALGNFLNTLQAGLGAVPDAHAP